MQEVCMPDILHKVMIAAAPERVFQALTQSQGVAAWWTPYAAAEPEVGSTVELRFGDDSFVHIFKVLTLEAKKVEWLTLQSLPEWNGTHLIWELSPAEEGTNVLFAHRGWASTEGLLPFSSYHWALYLTSLKDYLET